MIEPVDALIRKVGKVDRVIGRDEAAASILMDCGSSVEWIRSEFHYSTISRPFHYYEASLFLGTQLSPVDLASEEVYLCKLGCGGG